MWQTKHIEKPTDSAESSYGDSFWSTKLENRRLKEIDLRYHSELHKLHNIFNNAKKKRYLQKPPRHHII